MLGSLSPQLPSALPIMSLELREPPASVLTEMQMQAHNVAFSINSEPVLGLELPRPQAGRWGGSRKAP